MKINNLQAQIEDKKILQDINFTAEEGEVTVIMGPNGSGKSTLASAIMGHPSYAVQGEVILDEKNILDLEANERSLAGVFLSFQYPTEIEGVTVKQFLRQAVNAHREKPIRISEFKKTLTHNMELLHIPTDFADRYLNKGFSGGEKKKMEILQLLQCKKM
jgi:Fe-S cluster assembly ATP-binding protein